MEIISAILLITSLVLTIATGTSIECKITNEEQNITMEENNVQKEKSTDKTSTSL